ncbi:MAG: hypothetical protein ABSG56_10730 [Bryobacteraceae bacterium]|jgi:hypothetical protein
MKLIDQARLGDLVVLECAQEEWPELLKDRAAMMTFLNDTVAIDVQNVAEWMATDWAASLNPEGVPLSLDVFPNVKPSFPQMWFEFQTSTGQKGAVWAIDFDSCWALTLWDNEDNKLKLTNSWWVEQDPTGKLLLKGFIPGANETQEELEQVISAPTVLVLLTQDLMHCKNIVLERQEKPPKLVKSFKRKHEGKEPAVYSVININPMRTVIRKAGGVEKTGVRRAYGIIRGNFAVYTTERPLFGKVAGRFFRKAHHVGDPAIGIKKSDYKVNPPATLSHLKGD